MRAFQCLPVYIISALDGNAYINTLSLRQLLFSHSANLLLSTKNEYVVMPWSEPSCFSPQNLGKRRHAVFLRQKLKKRIPENHFPFSKIPFQPLHETYSAFMASPKVHINHGMLSSAPRLDKNTYNIFLSSKTRNGRRHDLSLPSCALSTARKIQRRLVYVVFLRKNPED